MFMVSYHYLIQSILLTGLSVKHTPEWEHQKHTTINNKLDIFVLCETEAVSVDFGRHVAQISPQALKWDTIE